jgi:diketogulonate reductase-like aldo/keto reductase
MNDNLLLIAQFPSGTFPIENNEMENVIEQTLEIEYHHIDCTWIYRNEKSIETPLTNQVN